MNSVISVDIVSRVNKYYSGQDRTGLRPNRICETAGYVKPKYYYCKFEYMYTYYM